MNKSGHVEYGAIPVDGGFRPMITIQTKGGSVVEFSANVILKNQKDTHDFVIGVYKILSGKQNNMEYSPEGRDPKIL